MNEVVIKVIGGVVVMALFSSSTVRSIAMFLIGLIAIGLIFIGVFEYGNILLDLSIFEVCSFIGLIYLMIRTHLIAKEGGHNLILAQLNPVRKVGLYFMILMVCIFGLVFLEKKFLIFNLEYNLIVANNGFTLVSLVLMNVAFYRGSPAVKNKKPTVENEKSSVEEERESV
jgi:hypothetical protein